MVLSYLSRFATTPSDLLIYTLGFIFLNTGLALYLNFSVLLANMFMAAVLVNAHKFSFRFFEALRTVDSPLYLLFFVLAGANLERLKKIDRQKKDLVVERLNWDKGIVAVRIV